MWLAVGASSSPAQPPPRNYLVELGLLGLVQLPGSVVDALDVQPHTQYPFCLVVSLVVPRPVIAGRPVDRDFSQALLPARSIISLPCRWPAPTRDDIESLSIDRGEGALCCFLAAMVQPSRQGFFAG